MCKEWCKEAVSIRQVQQSKAVTGINWHLNVQKKENICKIFHVPHKICTDFKEKTQWLPRKSGKYLLMKSPGTRWVNTHNPGGLRGHGLLPRHMFLPNTHLNLIIKPSHKPTSRDTLQSHRQYSFKVSWSPRAKRLECTEVA